MMKDKILQNPKPRGLTPFRVDWEEVRGRVQQAAEATSEEARAAREAEQLRRRAEAIARPIATNDALSESTGMVTFELGGQTFGVAAADMREAMAARDITPLPGLPTVVRGLANVRSRVVPVFDLRPLLQLPLEGEAEQPDLLLLAVDGHDLAVLVDRVVGARDLATAAAQRHVPGLNAEFVHSLTDDGIVVLNLRALVRELAAQAAGIR